MSASGSFIAPALLRRPTRDGLPAGPRAPELIQSAGYGLDPYGFFFRAHRRWGDVYTVRVLSQTWVVVADPEAAREIFVLGPEDVNSGETNVDLRPILGTGNVGLLDGEEHKQRRRIVLPSLRSERMPAYEQMVHEVAERRVGELPLDRPFAALPRMRRITFDVLLRGVLGVEDPDAIDHMDGRLESLLAYSMNPVRGGVFALLGPDGLARMPGFKRRHAALDEDVYREIRLRRDDPRLDGREDLLSRLLRIRDEQGVALPDEELRDEIVTLLVAGQETTASTLAWAVHELARAPEAQERLAAGEEGWADAVIRETLRMHPPIVIILRRLRRDLRVAGHDLPEGTTVAVGALLIHRRADLYPDPDEFRPERFLGTRTSPGEWMPFGGGARRCLGAPLAQLEARMVLERLVRDRVLRPVRARRERAGRRGIVTVPGRGGRVILSARGG